MVTIPAQFNGPDTSGNGGYTAGLLAGALDHVGPVTSTLRQPPPLDTPVSWEHDTDEVRLLTAGGGMVGTASVGSFDRDVPACPTADQAAAGRAAYPGFDHHPFDRCFTCGTSRDEGDGLRVFAGPVDLATTGTGLTAAPWQAHPSFDDGTGSISHPVTWAALDCPGGWAADFTHHLMVLGRMTAEVTRRPRVGEPCRAVGRLHARDGRKFFTDTALYTDAGELLGRSEQVWIELPAAG